MESVSHEVVQFKNTHEKQLKSMGHREVLRVSKRHDEIVNKKEIPMVNCSD